MKLQKEELEYVLGLLRLALWPPTTFPGLADMLMFVERGFLVGGWKCGVKVGKMFELLSWMMDMKRPTRVFLYTFSCLDIACFLCPQGRNARYRTIDVHVMVFATSTIGVLHAWMGLRLADLSSHCVTRCRAGWEV